MNLQSLQTEWRDYSGGELEGSPAWDDSPRGVGEADGEEGRLPYNADEVNQKMG